MVEADQPSAVELLAVVVEQRLMIRVEADQLILMPRGLLELRIPVVAEAAEQEALPVMVVQAAPAS